MTKRNLKYLIIWIGLIAIATIIAERFDLIIGPTILAPGG
jgi:hypothetical protein